MIIVNYHNVLAAAPNRLYQLLGREWEAQEEFDRQIAALQERFKIVPLAAIIDAIRRDQQIPRACAITFDDGNFGAYKYGLPVLEKYRIPATFFVITQHVRENGRYAPYYCDRIEAMLQLTTQTRLDLSDFGYDVMSLSRDEEKTAFFKEFRRRIKVTPVNEKKQIDLCLEQQLGVPEEKLAPFLEHEAYRLMGWDELVELRRRGHEIGSHTRTHPSLSQIDASALELEICGSYRDLKEKLGLQEISFAYPFGKPKHISDAAIAMVQAAGYNSGLTMKEGENTPATNLYKLRRMDFRSIKQLYF